MGRAPFGIALAVTQLLAGCAQGDLDAGASFGMTNPVTSVDDDDDDSGSADDDGSSGGSAGGTSGAGSTSAPADDTTALGSADNSSGEPLTATAEESSSAASEVGESSSGAATTTEPGEESTEDDMGDEMPMEDDDGAMDADAWESCATMNCVAGSSCINVIGLRDYSPYCAPECTVDADCPDPGGDAELWCALVPEGETDPTQCVAVCEFDDAVLGACPMGMMCVDVPDQMTQIAVCMWP